MTMTALIRYVKLLNLRILTYYLFKFTLFQFLKVFLLDSFEFTIDFIITFWIHLIVVSTHSLINEVRDLIVNIKILILILINRSVKNLVFRLNSWCHL